MAHGVMDFAVVVPDQIARRLDEIARAYFKRLLHEVEVKRAIFFCKHEVKVLAHGRDYAGVAEYADGFDRLRAQGIGGVYGQGGSEENRRQNCQHAMFRCLALFFRHNGANYTIPRHVFGQLN